MAVMTTPQPEGALLNEKPLLQPAVPSYKEGVNGGLEVNG
jgi:hypothetical protein